VKANGSFLFELMSTHNGNSSAEPAQDSSAVSTSVDMRIQEKSGSKVRAYADLDVRIGSLGSVRILGVSVYQPGEGPPVVLMPAHRGTHKSFPHVQLMGRIRKIVEGAVLREYESTISTETK